MLKANLSAVYLSYPPNVEIAQRYSMEAIVSTVLFGLLTLIAMPSMASVDEYLVCASCHGAQGEGGVVAGAPGLSQLPAWYIERQLHNFRGGVRGGEDEHAATMQTMASMIKNDRTVTMLAEYIEAFPAVTPATNWSGNIKNGEDYYTQKCGACHGTKAVGNVALHAPTLTGLGGDYIYRQLVNYRSKKRGLHQQDKFGKQMVVMAATLPTEQSIIDVVSYIESIGR